MDLFHQYIKLIIMNPIQIRLKVHLHRVRLQVRFACSLLAILKVQNNEAPFSLDQISLQSGETKLQSSTSQVFSILFDSEQRLFSEKDVSISLILKTGKGKISAGSVNIDLNKINKQMHKQKFVLEKCPDKHAYIEASVSYEILDELNKDSLTIDEKPRIKSYSFQNCKQKNQSEEQQVEVSVFPLQSNKSLLRISKQQSKTPSSSKLDLNNSVENLKLNLMKSLKTHIKPALNSDRSQNSSSSPAQQNIISKRGQSQRQLKNIHTKYEQASMELKNTHARLDILQKSLKQSEIQVKFYRQKYEDLDRSNSHIQKRSEFKQNNLKEQIKTLTQRLAVSDSQRQSMIFEKNTLISEFEQRQRGLRLNLRQKQRLLIDQRNKLSRKNEQLGKQISNYAAKIGQYDLKLELVSKQLSLQVKKSEALQQTCQGLTIAAEDYRQSYLQQKLKRQQLESIATQFQQSEQEKTKLKKKIVEQEIQNVKLSKMVVELEINYKNYLKNSQQMQTALKDKMTCLKAMQKEAENSAKLMDSMKKLLEQKQKTINQIGLQRQRQAGQIQHLNNQQRQYQRKHLQQVKSLTRVIHDKQALIQRLQQEIEGSKSLALVYDDKLTKFQAQIEDLNNKLTQMDYQYDQIKFSKIALEDTISDLEGKIETQTNHFSNQEQNWRSQLKMKENQIKILQENLQNKDRDNIKSKQQYNLKIIQLENKIISIELEKREIMETIESLNALIRAFEQEKSQNMTKMQELQYKLGLKAKQIAFLKQNADKNHQENIHLSTQCSDISMEVQNANQTIIQKQQQLLAMTLKLNQQNGEKQQIRKEFEEYARLNGQNIKNFLAAIVDEANIGFRPIHQQLNIQTAMQASLKRLNQIYKDYNYRILELAKQIQQKTNEYNQKSKRYQQNEANLQMSLQKNQEHSKQLETQIQLLQTDSIHLNNIILNLQKDLQKVVEKNKALQVELQILSSNMEKVENENASLKKSMEVFEQSIRNQEEDFRIIIVRQSNKFQQQSFNLQLTISELQQKLKRQESNNILLHSRLAECKDQSIMAKAKSSQEIASLKGQLETVFAQSQRKSRRLEEMQGLYLQSAQAQKMLRQKWEAASLEIVSLRELSEYTSKLYNNSCQKQKEQEETIRQLKSDQNQLTLRQAQLQKSLQERSSELTINRQLIFNLENEKVKAEQELDIATALMKVKQDTITKLKQQISNISKQRDNIGCKLRQKEQDSLEQQRRYQNQIEQLIQGKRKCVEEMSEVKLNLEAAKQYIKSMQKNSSQQKSQLQAQIVHLNHQITKLNQQLSLLNKSFSQLQKTKVAQEYYLKPIRENMQQVSENMGQYGRASDQFQSNKNKLLKVASTKVESMSDKIINQRIRQVSMAYNKLKLLVLSCQVEESSKTKIGEQLKKVQAFLDRLLRGDK